MARKLTVREVDLAGTDVDTSVRLDLSLRAATMKELHRMLLVVLDDVSSRVRPEYERVH